MTTQSTVTVPSASDIAVKIDQYKFLGKTLEIRTDNGNCIAKIFPDSAQVSDFILWHNNDKIKMWEGINDLDVPRNDGNIGYFPNDFKIRSKDGYTRQNYVNGDDLIHNNEILSDVVEEWIGKIISFRII